MPTFRIIFSGLCAFIPRDGSLCDPYNFPREVTVLLPNALEPCILCPVGAILPPHFPLLVFDQSNFQATNDQAPFLAFEKPGQASRGAALLLRDDIYMLVDGVEPPPDSTVQPIHQHSPSPLPSDPYDGDDIDLLFPLNYAAPGATINPYLLGALTSDEPLIVARIHMRTGRLRTFEVSDEGWSLEELAELAKALDSDHGRCVEKVLCCDEPVIDLAKREKDEDDEPIPMASKIALELEFKQEVTFVLRKFNGRDPRRLVFSPHPDRPLDDVEIEIRNLEPDDLLGIPETYYQPGSVDPDLSIYFKLVNPEENAEWKIPFRLLSGTGLGKPCTPTLITETSTNSGLNQASPVQSRPISALTRRNSSTRSTVRHRPDAPSSPDEPDLSSSSKTPRPPVRKPYPR